MEKEIIKINESDRNWCNIKVTLNGYIVEFYQAEFIARNIKELNEIIAKNIKKFY